MSKFIYCLLSCIFLCSSYNISVENCTESYYYQDFQPALVESSYVEEFVVMELDGSDGSKCLDGTNYQFYIKNGSGSGVDKWQFYWQGASFCGADGVEFMESCYNRSKGTGGTSKSEYSGSNGSTIGMSLPYGQFSSNATHNPKFYNWNKVSIVTCDGANHQGYLEEPLYYNGTALYFRGYNNTMGVMEYLRKQYNLFDAKEIMFTGGSSGASAAFQYSTVLRDYFPKNIKMWAAPDAGFFIDTYSDSNGCYFYRYCIQNMVNILNMTAHPLYKNCKYSGDEFYKCLMIEYFYDKIEIPVFVIQSQVDYKQLTTLNGVHCIDEGLLTCDAVQYKLITRNREHILRNVLEIKKRFPKWGFWLRTCFEHTYHFTWGWYGQTMNAFSAETLNNSNIKDALYNWYDNLENEDYVAPSYIDLIDWKHNPACQYGASDELYSDIV